MEGDVTGYHTAEVNMEETVVFKGKWSFVARATMTHKIFVRNWIQFTRIKPGCRINVLIVCRSLFLLLSGFEEDFFNSQVRLQRSGLLEPRGVPPRADYRKA